MDDKAAPDGAAGESRHEREETSTDNQHRDPADSPAKDGADDRADDGGAVEDGAVEDGWDEDGWDEDGAADEWTGGVFWSVHGGGSRALLTAYRSAVRQAEELSAALTVAGLGGEVLAVTAGLDAAGRPLVRGVLTLAGARRLGDYLAAGGPPPGLSVRRGRPPWAA